MALVPGVVGARCSFRCDCASYANASFASVEAPDPPLVPVARLTGPSSASVCEGLRVGAALSSGGGGRALAYDWSGTTWDFGAAGLDGASNATAELAAVLETSTSDLDVPTSLLEAAADAGATALVAALVVTNFLGSSSAGPQRGWFHVSSPRVCVERASDVSENGVAGRDLEER